MPNVVVEFKISFLEKKNLISKELHEKSVYSIMIVQENKTEDHEF